MKQILIAASLAAISCANAFGAFVQCTPSTGTLLSGGSLQGDAVFTCTPSATANNISGDGLNVIAIQLLVSVTTSQSAGQTSTVYSLQANMSNNASLNNVAPNPIVLSFTSSAGTGSGSASTGDLTAASTPVALTDEFGTFTVTLSPSAFGGNPLPANGSASVFYNATAVSPVPEPTTMALLGGALLGLGWVRRKQ